MHDIGAVPLAFGAFRLDPGSRTLWHDGTAIELGGRATDVLTALLAAEGAVVTKEALLAAAWPAQIVEDNALQAQISALRKALGGAGRTLIVTVPGRGYRLSHPFPPPISASMIVPSPVALGPTTLLPAGRPSIAVLAFTNLSGDMADECLGDGIAGDLITELARSRALLVVARNSSFAYKGRAVDIREIGQELGVRYVLEGSVRRAGTRIRVTAQLIEAEGGMHLWAERYDRLLTDLFATQDEITASVAQAIGPAVESAEHSRMLRRRPDNMDAWDALQRARSLADAGDWAGVDTWFRRAIELDPGFAAPHAERAFCLWSAGLLGRMPFDAMRAEAEAESWQTIRLDPGDPAGYAMFAGCRCGVRDWEGALRNAARAVERGPSAWLPHWAMVMAHSGAGNLDIAARHVDSLHRIGPRDAGRKVARLMDVLLRFQQADYRRTADRAAALLDDYPDYAYPQFMLVAALGHLGSRDDAASALVRWLRVAPGQAALFAEKDGVPWWSRESSDQAMIGLRNAGWQG